jgi:kinesin family protein C2/C3
VTHGSAVKAADVARAERLAAEVAHLRVELEGTEEAKQMLNARVQKLQEQKNHADDAAKTSEEARCDIEQHNGVLKRSVASLGEELMAAHAQVAKETGKAAELERRLAECEGELDQVKSDLAKQEAATSDASIRATMAEEAAAQAREEAEAAAGQADEASRQLSEARSEKELLEETLQTQAEEHDEQQKRAATALAEVSAKARSRSVRATTLVKRCASAHGAIRSAGEGMRSLAAEVRAEAGAASADLSRLGKQLMQAACKLQTDAAEANRRFMRETRERRRAFNQLQELKGNIRVFARVRPLLGKEAAGDTREAVEATSDFDLKVEDASSSSSASSARSFSFDRVFGSASTQVEVYDEIAPVVMSAMDGFHVCIFAYGQTGSGKTFTMQGPDSDRGVYQRALEQIFEEAHSRRDSHEFDISVSMVEIYNETVHDLLCEADAAATAAAASSHTSSSSAASSSCSSTLSGAAAGAGGRVLEIKQGAEGVYMPGVTTEGVGSASAISALMHRGERCRSVGKTDANEHSSRSHSLLLIDVVGRSKIHSGVTTKGRLVLVDLAGSERVSKSGAAGQRMKEAQAINKSLSALGDVIGALTHKSAHIPYRNSKLTYLLQDSLGKDNKALMIVQVSPVPDSRSESVCSLNFASRVRKVEQGKARAHGESAESSKLKTALRSAHESNKAQAAALEQLRNQLKESQDKRARASEKLKVVEATADRAGAAKATLAKAKATAQKDVDALRVQVVEARKATAAEKARADRVVAELAKAKEEAKAASRAAHDKSGSAARKAREEAEAAAAASTSKAIAKERSERAKAVAAAVKEAEAKAKRAAEKTAAAALAQAERELKAEKAKRQALEARVRRMIASGGSASSVAAAAVPASASKSSAGRSRRSQSASAAVTPSSARTASRATGSSSSRVSASGSSSSSSSRSRGGTSALVRSRTSETKQPQEAEFDSGSESDDSGVVSFRTSSRKPSRNQANGGSKAPAGAHSATASVPEACGAAPPPPADEECGDWSESPVQAVRLAVDADEDDEDDASESKSDAVDADESLCCDDAALRLNDTFELRKARGGKGVRRIGEQLLDEDDEDDAGSEILGGISLAIDDDDEDGEHEQEANGGACEEQHLVATPGGNARLASAKRTRLGTPAAAPVAGRALPRTQAASAADSDDEDADEDEFRSADAVFGAKPEAPAGPADRELSVHARWAPGAALTFGTPEQMSTAPSYATRHEHGKSPHVKGILKRKQASSAVKRASSALARSSTTQNAATEAAAAPKASAPSSVTSASKADRSKPAVQASAARSRSASSASASLGSASKSTFSAGKSTSALLGSILRKSSRASVILGRTARGNAGGRSVSGAAARKHSNSATRVAPAGGTATAVSSAEATGTRAARSSRAGKAVSARPSTSTTKDAMSRWR